LTEAIALATFQDLLELNLFDNEIDDIQPLTSLILLEVLDQRYKHCRLAAV